MSTSAQDEMAERRRVLLQDASVREGSTYHQHAMADAQTPKGRFTAEAHSSIVGQSADPWPKMPEGNPWAGPDLVGPEPPLSAHDNPALLEQPPALPAQGNSGDAPSPTSLCDVAASPSFSSGDPGDGLVSQPSKHAPGRAPGSSLSPDKGNSVLATSGSSLDDLHRVADTLRRF
jgi:hypothetical protein